MPSTFTALSIFLMHERIFSHINSSFWIKPKTSIYRVSRLSEKIIFFRTFATTPLLNNYSCREEYSPDRTFIGFRFGTLSFTSPARNPVLRIWIPRALSLVWMRLLRSSQILIHWSIPSPTVLDYPHKLGKQDVSWKLYHWVETADNSNGESSPASSWNFFHLHHEHRQQRFIKVKVAALPIFLVLNFFFFFLPP